MNALSKRQTLRIAELASILAGTRVWQIDELKDAKEKNELGKRLSGMRSTKRRLKSNPLGLKDKSWIAVPAQGEGPEFQILMRLVSFANHYWRQNSIIQ